jgi:hypothetical protein
MSGGKVAPKTIGEVLDHIELIREELLAVQKSLEKMESADPDPPDGDGTRH